MLHFLPVLLPLFTFYTQSGVYMWCVHLYNICIPAEHTVLSMSGQYPDEQYYQSLDSRLNLSVEFSTFGACWIVAGYEEENGGKIRWEYRGNGTCIRYGNAVAEGGSRTTAICKCLVNKTSWAFFLPVLVLAAVKLHNPCKSGSFGRSLSSFFPLYTLF